ncbi:MAG: TIGR00268 family protein, partial [candidate division Zixibacteria bacterium]|nr:TIGR00268 family protein [candidate division Zixibacteria bacterium]
MAILNSNLQAKFRNLKEEISSCGKVVVAFSGGLDSGLVLYAAIEALGPDNVLAVTGDSESLSSDDKEYAANFIKTIDMDGRHSFIRTDELADRGYT